MTKVLDISDFTLRTSLHFSTPKAKILSWRYWL